MRMEPLRSLPIVSAPRPAATAAAPPPVDPPAVRVTSQGLFVIPYAIDPLKRQLEQFGRGNLLRANRERQPIGRRESRDETVQLFDPDEAAAHGDLDRLGAAGDAELLEEMSEVRLDRALADRELGGDFLVRSAVGHQLQRRHL